MRTDPPTFDSKRRIVLPLFLAAVAVAMTPSACSKPEQAGGMECSLVELRARPVDRSYDAVVRMDAVNVPDALKTRFQVLTPSLDLDLAGLVFEADGADPGLLEPGDVFVVPLNRTDWKFGLAEGDVVLCFQNFWDRLPPDERFHPTKTEAMNVARSLEPADIEGFVKPLPKVLPPEWLMVDEKLPTPDDTLGNLVFQKRRGDLTLEQVEVQYSYLTEAEKEEMATVPAGEFLSKWSDCARDLGQDVMIAGRLAVACDLEGQGDFAWTYRYFTVMGGLIVAVEIQSDPLEWGKTEEEKEIERRTDRVFLRYAYGPVGPEEWQVMIEIRMNLGGAFQKRSRAGETVARDFELTEDEFAAIQAALEENKFTELESRSGGAGGMESSISADAGGNLHTVRMKNFPSKPFDDIAAAIRRIVLPKVGEK
jgi:hypothetical protein